ncbi:hypothetical protein Maes01_00713 [Microbulbifer aestuariivivens]|uniref:Phage holin family protein n=1 Tax=Microbulbifer aestuariivivens TaxID=1908308 RepID=A0ABP9WM17_9GAMM
MGKQMGDEMSDPKKKGKNEGKEEGKEEIRQQGKTAAKAGEKKHGEEAENPGENQSAPYAKPAAAELNSEPAPASEYAGGDDKVTGRTTANTTDHTTDHTAEKSTENASNATHASLARAEAALTLLAAWSGNLQTLIRLELERTLVAGKRIVALGLVLLPLVIALILSACAGAGLLGYYFSQSIYLGFSVFLLAQLCVIVSIVLYQSRLQKLLGFSQTRQQVMEAINDVRATFK